MTFIKHLRDRPVTVHGLDFGIHAEITAFSARPNFYLTMRMELGDSGCNSTVGMGIAFQIQPIQFWTTTGDFSSPFEPYCGKLPHSTNSPIGLNDD